MFNFSCCCLVAQLCPTFCNLMDCSPPGSFFHGILQAKNTGVGCHFLLICCRITNHILKCSVLKLITIIYNVLQFSVWLLICSAPHVCWVTSAAARSWSHSVTRCGKGRTWNKVALCTWARLWKSWQLTFIPCSQAASPFLKTNLGSMSFCLPQCTTCSINVYYSMYV